MKNTKTDIAIELLMTVTLIATLWLFMCAWGA